MLQIESVIRGATVQKVGLTVGGSVTGIVTLERYIEHGQVNIVRPKGEQTCWDSFF